ncbi:MAG: hypothetical protein LH473_13930, partial [Chitinophagales bacterium]|nr:hypothetical protein [Chitinophagales bacterium]
MTQNQMCIDLTGVNVPDNYYNRMAFFLYYDENGVDPSVFDDFFLTQLPDAGPDVSKCPEQSVTLGSANTCDFYGATYSWAPSIGLSCTTCANPVCDVTATTTYTLTVTTPGGCTTTDNVTVTIETVTPIDFEITGDRSNCNTNGSTYTAVPANNNYNYQWQHIVYDKAGNILDPLASGISFTYHFTNTCDENGYEGTVCFIASYPENGCSFTKCIDVSCCCSSGAYYSVYDNSSLVLYGVNDKTFSSTDEITINGIFTVNTNVTFNGTNVKFAPNAKIVVTSGKKLEVNSNALLHSASCYAVMWDGLYTDGTTNEIKIDGSTVQDAQNAIVSSNGGKYTITNSTFNKNYIDFTVNPYTGVHPGTISKTKIQCTLANAPTTISLAPHIGARTSTGILINGATSINIGNATAGNANTFNNMDFGIVSTSSNTTIKNCQYKNVDYSGGGLCSPCNCQTGTAICAYASANTTATIGGSGANDLNTFEYCRIGIKATGKVSLTATYHTFNNVTLGVVLSSAANQSHNISHNTFNNFTSGINCTDIYCAALNNTHIDYNLFNIGLVNAPSIGTFAIQVQNTLLASNVLTINNNQIDYCRSGIKLINVKNYFAM